MTVKDLCQRFGVRANTVLIWIANGELKAGNVGRGMAAKKPRWRITEEALRAFEALEQREEESREAQARRRRKRAARRIAATQ